MTLAQIRESDKDTLTPADVASVLGVKAFSINCQAKEDITKLGFPCSLIGTRVRIPRVAFIRWMDGVTTTEE